MDRTIITGDKAKEHHPAATRLVVHGDYESWTRYLVLDRDECLRIFRDCRQRGMTRSASLLTATCPYWPQQYGGPGTGFQHVAHQHANNRRYLVIRQSGGLDV